MSRFLSKTRYSGNLTPAYSKTIGDLIPKYGFRNSSRFHQQFTERIQTLSRDLEMESRKKGACMLMVCIVLLGCSTFFPKNSEISIGHCISLTSYVILSLAGIVCSRYCFKCWRCVVIHGLLSLFAAIILGWIYRKWCYPIDMLESHKTLWRGVTKICIILVLILPIVWQLFINWLYSEVYQRHLIRLLNTEAELYCKFWLAYSKGKQEEIPNEYRDVLLAALMRGTGDLKVTEIIQTLYDRLLEACSRPRIRKLLGYIGKQCEEIKSISSGIELNALPDMNEQVPIQSSMMQKGRNSGLRTDVKRPYNRRKK